MRTRWTIVTGIVAATSLPLGLGCVATGVSNGTPSSTTEQSPPARELETFRIAVYGMTCDDCAEVATRRVRELSGVVHAVVDYDSKRAVVRAEPGRITFAEIQSALRALGFEGLPPNQRPIAPLPDDKRAALDIRTVSHGERIDVRAALAPGKITIFDYYADWCGPCRLLTPKLERLLLKYDEIALRKVDITKWESPAAKQASAEFELPGLPFTRVFDARGNLLGQVQGNFIERIEVIIRSHASPRKEARR